MLELLGVAIRVPRVTSLSAGNISNRSEMISLNLFPTSAALWVTHRCFLDATLSTISAHPFSGCSFSHVHHSPRISIFSTCWYAHPNLVGVVGSDGAITLWLSHNYPRMIANDCYLVNLLPASSLSCRSSVNVPGIQFRVSKELLALTSALVSRFTCRSVCLDESIREIITSGSQKPTYAQRVTKSRQS